MNIQLVTINYKVYFNIDETTSTEQQVSTVITMTQTSIINRSNLLFHQMKK